MNPFSAIGTRWRIAAIAVAMAFQAQTPKISLSEFARRISYLGIPTVNVGNETFVTPEIKQIYSQAELKALRELAGEPIVFMGGNDLTKMKPTDVDKIKLAEQRAGGHVSVSVIGGLECGKDALRYLMGVNFRDDLFDATAVHQVCSWLGAHEMAHVEIAHEFEASSATWEFKQTHPELYTRDLEADRRAGEFKNAHPELFSRLPGPDAYQFIFGAMRAWETLARHNPDDKSHHDSSAFCLPTPNDCAGLSGVEPGFEVARKAVLEKTAIFMYQNGMLKDVQNVPPAIVARQAMDRIMFPKGFDSNERVIDYAADKSGLFKKYLARRNVKDSQYDVVYFLSLEFWAELKNLLGNPDPGRAATSQPSRFITKGEALDFARKNIIYIAPQYLQDQLTAKALTKTYIEPHDLLTNRTIASIAYLRERGTFSEHRQSVYAANLANGSSRYLDPAVYEEALSQIHRNGMAVLKNGKSAENALKN